MLIPLRRYEYVRTEAWCCFAKSRDLKCSVQHEETFELRMIFKEPLLCHEISH
jgi:hypothetical protein